MLKLFKHLLLVFPAGVEPTAYRLGGGRSILLSYGNIFYLLKHFSTLYLESQLLYKNRLKNQIVTNNTFKNMTFDISLV